MKFLNPILPANFSLFAIFVSLLLTGNVFADGVDPAIAHLCASGNTEGGYPVNLPGFAHSTIYLVCQGDNILATLSDPEVTNPITFGYTAIDGDTISFLTFSPKPDDAPTFASYFTNARIEVNIASLVNGRLTGKYRSLYSKHPTPFSASRASVFPNLLANADTSKDYSSYFKGEFSYAGNSFLRQTGGGKVWLNNEIIGGTQRIDFYVNDGASTSLLNGLAISKAGNVFYVTSGNDPGAMGLKPMQHIRGRIINDSEIEFYYFSNRSGMLGPFRAKRGDSN